MLVFTSSMARCFVIFFLLSACIWTDNSLTSASASQNDWDMIVNELNCTVTTSGLPSVDKWGCFKLGPSYHIFASVVHLFTPKYCSLQEKMVETTLCDLAQTYKVCPNETLTKGDPQLFSTTTPESISKAVNYICQGSESLDWNCSISNLNNIQDCVDTEIDFVDRVLEDGGTLDRCRYHNTIPLCLWETLKWHCGQQTAALLTSTYNDYLMPSKCSSTSQHASTELCLLTLLFCSFFLVQRIVHC